MTSKKDQQTGQTVITLVLPDDGGIQRQGNIIAKYESGDGKQSVAHVMPFTFSTLAGIARAIDSAQQALEAVKRNPPQVTIPTEPAQPPKVEKPAKPSTPVKKKKPSLDDFPTDDEDDVPHARKPIPPSTPTTAPQQTMFTLKVGTSVTLKADAIDVDGDAIDFTDGRICEIDTNSKPPRIWVESVDGVYDVWVHEDAIVQPETDDLSEFEKPVGMGVPDKEGQLTLFG
jgi:hypothetical protein